MDWLVYVPLILLVLLSSFGATLVYHRQHQSSKDVVVVKPPVRQATVPDRLKSDSHRAAYKAGIDDVVKGWFIWAGNATDTERRDSRALVYVGMDESHIIAQDPQGAFDRVMAENPRPEWGVIRLRQHLLIANVVANYQDQLDAPTLKARRLLVAAMINDLRDETYDPSTSPITGRWAHHTENDIRACYLEGRSQGVEDIMDAVTGARTRLREIAASDEAIAAAGRSHAAALRALRETNQVTAARDQHKDYEAQVRAIEEGKQ